MYILYIYFVYFSQNFSHGTVGMLMTNKGIVQMDVGFHMSIKDRHHRRRSQNLIILKIPTSSVEASTQYTWLEVSMISLL
jgi:hypothetical protein